MQKDKKLKKILKNAFYSKLKMPKIKYLLTLGQKFGHFFYTFLYVSSHSASKKVV